MPLISKTETIKAPAERVFEVLSDPTLASELNPNLTITSYTPAAIGGFDNTWEYKMAGMKFTGETKMVEVNPPYRTVYETSGGLPSTWRWQLTNTGELTEVSVELDYTIPGVLNNPLTRPILERQNEKVLENQLANLKRISETR
jgi:uncharacterized protein YndB with AHSA1/START domain